MDELKEVLNGKYGKSDYRLEADYQKKYDEDMTNVLNEINGWNKLVFKAINNIESSVFSLDDLKDLDIFEMYQFEDQSLENIILENLNDLANLKLIEKLGNNYYKKVV